MAAGPVLVVGVDGYPTSQRSLVVAADLATLAAARLVAVHVKHVPAAVHASPSSGLGHLTEANEDAADHAHLDCELVLGLYDLRWSFEVRQGDPATELARVADAHDAVCIVVGRHGRHRIPHIAAGSVTDRLLRRAGRPVLVVPSAAGPAGAGTAVRRPP
jgi:nucleotide-binding universal stress UspA family protein